jgi:hypothetical protein
MTGQNKTIAMKIKLNAILIAMSIFMLAKNRLQKRQRMLP